MARSANGLFVRRVSCSEWRFSASYCLHRKIDAQLWFSTQLWPAFRGAVDPSVNNMGSERQLDRIVQELDLLKKNTNELGTTQQQMTAITASPQAGQQELQRPGSSFHAGRYWYSDPAVLMYRVAPQEPGTVASPKQTPTGRAPSEAQVANVGRPDERPPLRLSPQP